MKDLEYFEKFADQCGIYEVYPPEEYERILKIIDIAVEDKNKRILDIGCGSGSFSLRLSKLGFFVVGVDICYKLLELAIGQKKDVVFINADSLNLPFKKESFDIIFCAAFLHHLPKQIALLSQKFFSLLKPNGKIYFFEPYSPCLNSLLRYWILNFNRTEDERALNPRKVKTEFEKAGFVNFQYRKIKKIKHNYYLRKDSPIKKFVGFLRKLINEYFIPNISFIGSAQKQ